MVTLIIVFTTVWFISLAIVYLYLNKFLLNRTYNKDNFMHKHRYQLQTFLTEDNQIQKKKNFVIIVGGTLITLTIFILFAFIVYATYQGIVSTLIFTVILVIILYLILKSFIKALAYQLFEKH